MLNLPDRQIERHMASQSAEKEAKQRMSFNLLTILLMFFSVCWSPEVSLLSLGPWLFSWRSLCDQQKLLAHSASSFHHCCLWETCSFILLFVSPHFQPRAPVWVCLQPLPRTALVPYVRLPDLLWSHFPYSATSFTSSSPCTATSFPASHTVIWWDGVGPQWVWEALGDVGFEVWYCLEGIPCPCWQLPSAPCVENQLFFVKVSLLLVNTGCVQSVSRLEFLLYIRQNVCTFTLTSQEIFSSSF